jgi:hypothetical protein
MGQNKKALAKKKKREQKIRKDANRMRNPSNRDIASSMVRRPWHECIMIDSADLMQIFCVRTSRFGVSACVFLVDPLCLGVKDAAVIREVDVEQVRQRKESSEGETVEPAYAKKYILDAVEWSRKLGFEPHVRYGSAMEVFADVDAGQCDASFEFGANGKPHYIRGPYEDKAKVELILSKLQQLGEGNYSFTYVESDSSRSLGLDYDEFDDDEFDDEDYNDDDTRGEYVSEDWNDDSRTVDGTVVSSESPKN